MIELNIQLQPKQREAFDKSKYASVLGYGGAKGGGKSYFIRAREIYRRLQFPYSVGTIFRKTNEELWENHIRKFFSEYPCTRDWYSKEHKTIFYPNGSVTKFAYLRYTSDVDAYQGIPMDDVSLDEATQHDYYVFQVLRSSNRVSSDKSGITPSFICTFNPGGIGHAWVKRLFIDRKYECGENPSDFEFTQAFLADNQVLERSDPTYRQRLENLPPHLREAYLLGNWNIFAGQAFSELSTDVHLIEPFALPDQTRYFGGYDYGFNHPFAFVLFAITPENKVYVVNYLKKRQLNADIHGERIAGMLDGKNINIYAGTDIWSKKDGRDTWADQIGAGLARKGNRSSLFPADTNRKQGVARIRELISYQGTTSGEPRLKFFKNCEAVFDCVKSMAYSDRDPEDVVKVDADEYGNGGDDLYDAFRYGVMSSFSPAKIKEQRPAGTTGEDLLKIIRRSQKGW